MPAYCAEYVTETLRGSCWCRFMIASSAWPDDDLDQDENEQDETD
jgi:hypothetical protein